MGKIMKTTLACVLLLFAFTVSAQPPAIDWELTFDFGDTTSTFDPHESFLGVRGLDDGGYILCGYTDHGSVEERGLVMRMNVQGEVLWTAEIDRSPNPISWEQRIFDIVPTRDGGFAAVGHTDNSPNQDNFVAKFSDTGFQEWMTASWDGFVKIRERPDGVLVVAEKGGIDTYHQIFNYSSEGDLLSSSTGISGGLYDLEIDADGNYVTTGRDRYSYDGAEFRMTKLTPPGQIAWGIPCFDGLLGVGHDVEVAADGNYVACGSYGSNTGGWHTALVKVSPDGTILWHRGQPGGWRLVEMGDRGFVVAGFEADGLVLYRTGSFGNPLWSTIVDSTMKLEAMDVSRDGGIILAGSALDADGFWDMKVIKFMPEANILLEPDTQVVPSGGGMIQLDVTITHRLLRETTLPGMLQAVLPNGHRIEIQSFDLALIPDEDIQVSDYPVQIPASAPSGIYTLEATLGDPDTEHALGFASVTFEKLSTAADNGGIPAEDSELILKSRDKLQLNASPNPFNPATTISLALPDAGEVMVRVLNVLGQQVATVQDGVLPAGSHRFVFDGSALSSGVYFVQVQAGSESLIRKVLLTR